MPSSGSRPLACAGQTCGRIVAFSRLSSRPPRGHEYCGIVEDAGSAVTTIKPGQFVIGSFFASDNTYPNCRVGYQSSCQHAEFIGTAQAPLLRVPLADGTLVATRMFPRERLCRACWPFPM